MPGFSDFKFQTLTTRPARKIDYDTNKLLTTYRIYSMNRFALLIEGRVLETILKAEQGVASRGCGS
jgi:hypothetical protein